MMNDDYIRTNEEYRRLLATANKLESIQSNLDSVIDFFVPQIVKLYSKLCNDCLKLLFECEFKLDYFRKAEELVWRRVYHDIYRFQRTKRQAIRRQDECLIESHFISGIGFYSSLIIRLRSHYQIQDVSDVIDPLNFPLYPIDDLIEHGRTDEFEKMGIPNGHTTSDDHEDTNSTNDVKRQWARLAIYRSLVYMGDLARYLQETSLYNYRMPAFKFYRSASRFQSDYGLPFNQLATLAGGLNHNLDAVCNYMRCCMRRKPFEGAEGNMRKIFELNKKFYDELNKHHHVLKISEVLASKEPAVAAESMVRSTIVIFIKLISDLWENIVSNSFDSQTDVLQSTSRFFEVLREAIELEPIIPLASASSFEKKFAPVSGGSNDTEKPKYISPSIMYEFCSITIMLVAKCQKHAKSDNDSDAVRIRELVNTLALNLLHYATSKCQRMIQSKVHELRFSRQELSLKEKKPIKKPISESNIREYISDLSTASQKSADNLNASTEGTNQRNQFKSRLRQRKAAENYSTRGDRVKSHSSYNEDSDLSDLEETALSTIDALDISSEMSDDANNEVDDLIDLGSSGSGSHDNMKDSRHPKGSPIKLSKPLLRPTRSQNYELDRPVNLAESCSSLPVPDLLTGDQNDRMVSTSANNNKSPSSSLNEFDTMSNFRKDPCWNDDVPTSLDSVLAHIYNQSYLPTLKIYFDWLLSDVTIINTNLQSFRSYRGSLDEIVALLNGLKSLTEPRFEQPMMLSSSDTSLASSRRVPSRNEDASSTYKHTFDGPEWIQKYPLSCDYPLVGLEPLKGVQEFNIDFNHYHELNDSEAGFITIQCIFAFSYALNIFLENKDSQC